MQEEDNPFKFKNNLNSFTIGVELEVQILRRDNFDLFSISPFLLEKIPQNIKKFIKPEFIQSMIEITTGVCDNVTQVEKELLYLYKELEKICNSLDAMLFVSSLHPFSKIAQQKLFPDPRYKRLFNELQQIGRRFISQGLHVHIGVKDEDMAIKVYDRLLRWLPVLLAISSSSPFYQGRDTGFASYRSKLFKALPLSGMPEPLMSWDNFCFLTNTLKSVGIISTIRDLWWDVRPHPTFGTVEIRICDVPMRFKQVVAIVAMIQALVSYVSELDNDLNIDKYQDKLIFSYLLKYNKWQAARYGMNAKYVSINDGNLIKRDIKDVFRELLEILEPYFYRLKSDTYLKDLSSVITRGSNADELRGLKQQGYNFKDIIVYFRKEFLS